LAGYCHFMPSTLKSRRHNGMLTRLWLLRARKNLSIGALYVSCRRVFASKVERRGHDKKPIYRALDFRDEDTKSWYIGQLACLRILHLKANTQNISCPRVGVLKWRRQLSVHIPKVQLTFHQMLTCGGHFLSSIPFLVVLFDLYPVQPVNVR
jgi:hypothetical protein